jgi:branched-chain amino acid transport system substrate-binding protein
VEATRTSVWFTVPALSALLLGACTQPGEPRAPGPAVATPTPVPVVRVAFVADQHDAEAAAWSAPAYQAASLAFSNAETGPEGLPATVEVVSFDTGGDPARTAEVAQAIVADPSFVAAIAGPGLGAQATLGDAFEEAGVPWLSLSTLGTALEDRGWTAWRRVVADQSSQAAKLAALAEGQRGAPSGYCIAGDGTAPSRSLLRPVVRDLGEAVTDRVSLTESQAAIAQAAARMRDLGCGVVLWGGEGSLGAALRRQLEEIGAGGGGFLGGDRLRTQRYLDVAGPDAEGTLATCPCVDLSLATELSAQRFIQDYQSEFGLPPGPYAAEAWDAARMLVAALRAGAITRGAVRGAVHTLDAFDGIAGTYRFGEAGEVLAGPMDVRVYVVEGGRWLEEVGDA